MPSTRRHFLKQTGLGAAAAAVGGASPNDRLTVGVIGCGGMGTSHARHLAPRKDVRIAYVCDPDSRRAANAARAVEKAGGKAPRPVPDLRRVLDDPKVDAVWIATCDHWHAPAAILAAGAGKHVYVEKPCSHNIREGRLMIEAARKNNRVMQVGTQSRSAEHNKKAIDALRRNAIGDVLVAKAWNSQKRRNIGHAKPSDPPKHLDYDLWVGPAPSRPYQSNLLHYNWHWFYTFGTGDLGNDGVHNIDVSVWGLGVDAHPVRVAGLGGKYHFDDDQEFPDTQYVVFEYPGKQKRQLVYEHRIWSPYNLEGISNGNAFYGTKGWMLLNKAKGFKIFGPGNELLAEEKGSLSVVPHHTDFLEAIRNSRRPAADIETHHFAATICHLGNNATRLGRSFRFDGKRERAIGDEEANRLVRREYREGHWAVPKGV